MSFGNYVDLTPWFFLTLTPEFKAERTGYSKKVRMARK